jgi:hypothetical protein
MVHNQEPCSSTNLKNVIILVNVGKKVPGATPVVATAGAKETSNVEGTSAYHKNDAGTLVPVSTFT